MPIPRLLLLLLFILSRFHRLPAAGGRWKLLKKSIGISSMHMQLLHNDRLVIYDRTDFGASNLSLPAAKCRTDPNDIALKLDCTAHSLEYDVASNTIRPLALQTDVWCSSGSLDRSGNLVQAGGFNDGQRRVRIFRPCETCDWKEVDGGLGAPRWYATSQGLPDGRQIIIGGRNQFSYEFYPKTSSSRKVYALEFLKDTSVPAEENNLYPFVFLNVDGNLFIFANNRAILFDYKTGTVLRTYPAIPGGDPRNYPSTGSAALLPLRSSDGTAAMAEVLVCGGAPAGSFRRAVGGVFTAALRTCGRIRITDTSPRWAMERMPQGRVMGDMILLPTGDVLIVNGASMGTAGWELGRGPALTPVIYKPDEPAGARFEPQRPTSIPRMYHSSAVLVRDGRVLVGGSNPHAFYNFTGVLFPTELSLEAFFPPYLDPGLSDLRPIIRRPVDRAVVGYWQRFEVEFHVTGRLSADAVSVTMVAPSFNSHSFSMSQRVVIIGEGNVTRVHGSVFRVHVTAPGSGHLAPPGFYLLHVVHRRVPSMGIWLKIR